MNKTRQWAVATGVAVLVVFAIGWLLLVSPQRSKAHDLDTQAAGAQQQLSSLHVQLAQLLDEKKNLPAEQKLLASVAAKIPPVANEPELIRQLQAAAASADVDLSSLAPSAPVPLGVDPTTGTTGTAGTTLYQIPLAITVSGGYFNVELFEHALETLPRALLVSGINIAPAQVSSGSGTTAKSDDVSASISAMVFESPTAAVPAATIPSVTSTSGSAPATTASPSTATTSTETPAPATTPSDSAASAAQ